MKRKWDHRYKQCGCGRAMGWTSKHCRTCRNERDAMGRQAPRRPTDYELRVLGMRAAGMRPCEIGRELGRSVKTIENTLHRVRGRLGLRDREALLEWARVHHGDTEAQSVCGAKPSRTGGRRRAVGEGPFTDEEARDLAKMLFNTIKSQFP